MLNHNELKSIAAVITGALETHLPSSTQPKAIYQLFDYGQACGVGVTFNPLGEVRRIAWRITFDPSLTRYEAKHLLRDAWMGSIANSIAGDGNWMTDLLTLTGNEEKTIHLSMNGTLRIRPDGWDSYNQGSGFLPDHAAAETFGEACHKAWTVIAAKNGLIPPAAVDAMAASVASTLPNQAIVLTSDELKVVEEYRATVERKMLEENKQRAILDHIDAELARGRAGNGGAPTA